MHFSNFLMKSFENSPARGALPSLGPPNVFAPNQNPGYLILTIWACKTYWQNNNGMMKVYDMNKICAENSPFSMILGRKNRKLYNFIPRIDEQEILTCFGIFQEIFVPFHHFAGTHCLNRSKCKKHHSIAHETKNPGRTSGDYSAWSKAPAGLYVQRGNTRQFQFSIKIA